VGATAHTVRSCCRPAQTRQTAHPLVRPPAHSCAPAAAKTPATPHKHSQCECVSVYAYAWEGERQRARVFESVCAYAWRVREREGGKGGACAPAWMRAPRHGQLLPPQRPPQAPLARQPMLAPRPDQYIENRSETGRQTGRHTDRQTDRQADRHIGPMRTSVQVSIARTVQGRPRRHSPRRSASAASAAVPVAVPYHTLAAILKIRAPPLVSTESVSQSHSNDNDVCVAHGQCLYVCIPWPLSPSVHQWV
jgi:hypothetical protein